MDMNSQAWKIIHDMLSRVVDPGESFARALAWCEDYVDQELSDRLSPRAVAELAVRAYLSEARARYAVPGQVRQSNRAVQARSLEV